MRNAVLPAIVVLLAALFLPTPASAQELTGRVEAGDAIFVTEHNGVQTDGLLLRTAPEGLTLLVDGQERLIPSSGVGRIEKRDSRWNGMLIGALPMALVGTLGAGASCSPHCGRDVPLAALINGAIGAGVGALIDSVIHGYSTVAGPPLSPPNARRTPAPVGSVGELWQRVREGDSIEVATSRGQTVNGKFVRVSATSLTLTAGGAIQEIPSSDIRRVTRSGNRYRSGALWGGLIVGAGGALASAACSQQSNSCGNPLLAGLATGGAGALWGTIIGALIPKHTEVYKPDGTLGVRVAPMLQVGRVGVALSTSF